MSEEESDGEEGEEGEEDKGAAGATGVEEEGGDRGNSASGSSDESSSGESSTEPPDDGALMSEDDDDEESESGSSLPEEDPEEMKALIREQRQELARNAPCGEWREWRVVVTSLDELKELIARLRQEPGINKKPQRRLVRRLKVRRTRKSPLHGEHRIPCSCP